MQAIIFFTLLLANFNNIKAGYDSNCEIEGVDAYSWGSWASYTKKPPIGDTHEGLVATFKTKNILNLTSYSSTYLNASFSDGTLNLFTNERFEKFEEEYDGSSTISIKLYFACSDDTEDFLVIQQKVFDVNTNDPILNEKVYEYHFGMTLPEGFDLTRFMRISATDADFTNEYIYYTFDRSEDLLIKYHGETESYYSDIYFTNIKTLREIKAPFRKEFTLVVRDGGDPSRNSTARLIVTVTSNGTITEEGSDESNENTPHPPVFAEHLYFGNYTSDHDLEMDQTISIKYGFEKDISIKQSGYEEYFKISLDPKTEGALKVTNLKSLPKKIIETTRLLVIEIEAVNKDLLHVPGRTALIIRLLTDEQDDSQENSNENSHENSTTCTIGYVHYENNTLLILFFLMTIFMIVMINVVILAWFYQKRKVITNISPEQYPVSQMPRQEILTKM